MSGSVYTRLMRLERLLANTPRFTAVQLNILADGLEAWQMAHEADGTAVVAELRRSIDDMTGTAEPLTIAICGGCRQELQLVRPGKWQCVNPNCPQGR